MGSERTNSWDKYILTVCDTVSTRSEDPDTHVGCVVVGLEREIKSTGWNGLPRGVKSSPERLQRPEKYKWIEHAERNAIYAAARAGLSLLGCTMYVTYWPCVDCARGIVQSGITRLVTHGECAVRQKREDVQDAVSILLEAGVELTVLVMLTSEVYEVKTMDDFETFILMEEE